MRIDYFVAVDLRSFRAIINDLGGVIIDVQNPVYDFHYAADDASGHLKLYIPPGIQYMEGQEALAYGRARHETSDFDRSARQQNVITSVRKQLDLPSLLAPGVLQDLLKTFRSSIKTDIPPDKIPALIQLAQEIDLDKRISLALDPPDYSTVCYPCPPSGLYEIKANVAKHAQGRRATSSRRTAATSSGRSEIDERGRRSSTSSTARAQQHQDHQDLRRARFAGCRTPSCRPSTAARPPARTTRRRSSRSTTARRRPCPRP